VGKGLSDPSRVAAVANGWTSTPQQDRAQAKRYLLEVLASHPNNLNAKTTAGTDGLIRKLTGPGT
jgi:hypothetical protein